MPAFFKSFLYAGKGIAYCLRERNFRFHISLSIYMYTYLLVYDWFRLSRGEWAALILATMFVLAAEAANTALEALVDLVSPEHRPLAAKAKDVAAGAVLCCAAGAVGVGLAVLWQPEAFAALAAYYRERPVMLAVLAGSLLLTGWFVFAPKGKEKKR